MPKPAITTRTTTVQVDPNINVTAASIIALTARGTAPSAIPTTVNIHEVPPHANALMTAVANYSVQAASLFRATPTRIRERANPRYPSPVICRFTAIVHLTR